MNTIKSNRALVKALVAEYKRTVRLARTMPELNLCRSYNEGVADGYLAAARVLGGYRRERLSDLLLSANGMNIN